VNSLGSFLEDIAGLPFPEWAAPVTATPIAAASGCVAVQMSEESDPRSAPCGVEEHGKGLSSTPPHARLRLSARTLLLRAASKMGRAAQRNPRIRGFKSQPIKETDSDGGRG